MKTEFLWIKDITQHPEYYIQMFGQKEITRALGACMHADDCDEWLLAVQKGMLLGFSGYEKTRDVFVLKRAFVFPQYRRVGLYRKMLDMRIQKAVQLGAKVLQATTTVMSREEFERRDFRSLKKFKKYQTYRLLL
jgi:GNAT superfamily N-acetyltransferase